ncbi:anthrone oxygenase family protein [Kribbella sp. NPDC054772]
MARIVRSASLLFSGLFAGFLVCVMVLELSLRSFGASVYTQVRLVELDSLDKLASVTLIPAIVTTVALAIWGRGNGRRFVLVALALLVLVFVLTLAINLPINADQASWSVQHPPADWADVRDRWQVAHAIRTVAAVVAFGTLVVGSQLTATAKQQFVRGPAPGVSVGDRG